MEVHQLRYFAAAAEMGNLNRAAGRCHVAQPSLTQEMFRLEEMGGLKYVVPCEQSDHRVKTHVGIREIQECR
jgi:hypothetical protein